MLIWLNYFKKIMEFHWPYWNRNSKFFSMKSFLPAAIIPYSHFQTEGFLIATEPPKLQELLTISKTLNIQTTSAYITRSPKAQLYNFSFTVQNWQWKSMATFKVGCLVSHSFMFSKIVNRFLFCIHFLHTVLWFFGLMATTSKSWHTEWRKTILVSTRFFTINFSPKILYNKVLGRKLNALSNHFSSSKAAQPNWQAAIPLGTCKLQLFC